MARTTPLREDAAGATVARPSGRPAREEGTTVGAGSTRTEAAQAMEPSDPTLVVRRRRRR